MSGGEGGENGNREKMKTSFSLKRKNKQTEDVSETHTATQFNTVEAKFNVLIFAF